MTRWLRDPVLVFFAIGAGLFLAYRLFNPGSSESISLDDAGLAVLFSEYEAVTGLAPDADRRRQIIDDYYRREVLYREGLRRGIHETDPALREAIIERMQLRVTGELPELSGRDLVNYYADNIQRYYAEATISVSQRFLREEPAEPAALLAALRAGVEPSFDPPRAGASLPGYGESMLRALFGSAILEVLRRLPVDTWSGPFASPRGWHFFRVDGRAERQPLSFERVRDQVRADFQADLLARRLDEFVDAQRARYSLEVAR